MPMIVLSIFIYWLSLLLTYLVECVTQIHWIFLTFIHLARGILLRVHGRVFSPVIWLPQSSVVEGLFSKFCSTYGSTGCAINSLCVFTCCWVWGQINYSWYWVVYWMTQENYMTTGEDKRVGWKREALPDCDASNPSNMSGVLGAWCCTIYCLVNPMASMFFLVSASGLLILISITIEPAQALR